MSTATSTDIAVDIAVDSTYSKHDPKINKVMSSFLMSSTELLTNAYTVNLICFDR